MTGFFGVLPNKTLRPSFRPSIPSAKHTFITGSLFLLFADKPGNRLLFGRFFINLSIHSLFQMVMITLFIHPFGNIFYGSIRDYLHPLTLTISIIKLKKKSVAVPERCE
jgi:hypothetical protein